LSQVASIEAGVRARNEWIVTAATKRQTREQELAEYELKLQAATAELETKRAARDAAEATETVERARIEAERAKNRSIAEEKALADALLKQQIENAVKASSAPDATPESIEAANAPLPLADADGPPPPSDPSAAFPYPAEYAAPSAAATAKTTETEAEAEKFPYPAEYAAPASSVPAADDFDDDDWEPVAADEATEEITKNTDGTSASTPAPAEKEPEPEPEYKDPGMCDFFSLALPHGSASPGLPTRFACTPADAHAYAHTRTRIHERRNCVHTASDRPFIKIRPSVRPSVPSDRQYRHRNAINPRYSSHCHRRYNNCFTAFAFR
jgi:hypothetical protein